MTDLPAKLFFFQVQASPVLEQVGQAASSSKSPAGGSQSSSKFKQVAQVAQVKQVKQVAQVKQVKQVASQASQASSESTMGRRRRRPGKRWGRFVVNIVAPRTKILQFCRLPSSSTQCSSTPNQFNSVQSSPVVWLLSQTPQCQAPPTHIGIKKLGNMCLRIPQKAKNGAAGAAKIFEQKAPQAPEILKMTQYSESQVAKFKQVKQVEQVAQAGKSSKSSKPALGQAKSQAQNVKFKQVHAREKSSSRKFKQVHRRQVKSGKLAASPYTPPPALSAATVCFAVWRTLESADFGRWWR